MRGRVARAGTTPDGRRTDDSGRAGLTAGQDGIAAGLAAPAPLQTERLAASASSRRGAPLTPRQLEILTLLRDGRTQGEVARLLGISYQTVKNHMTDSYARLGIPLGTPRGGALIAALQVTGLMTPGDDSLYRAETRVAQATATVAVIKAELAKLGRLLIAMAEES